MLRFGGRSRVLRCLRAGVARPQRRQMASDPKAVWAELKALSAYELSPWLASDDLKKYRTEARQKIDEQRQQYAGYRQAVGQAAKALAPQSLSGGNVDVLTNSRIPAPRTGPVALFGDAHVFGAPEGTTVGKNQRELVLALKHGDFNTAFALLYTGKAYANGRVGGVTPLSFLVRNSAEAPGTERLIKLLGEFGADPNFPDADGRTPLHHAAELDVPQAIVLVEKLGANINAHAVPTTRDLALHKQREGADTGTGSLVTGGTPLHYADATGYETLVGLGANPFAGDKNGAPGVSGTYYEVDGTPTFFDQSDENILSKANVCEKLRAKFLGDFAQIPSEETVDATKDAGKKAALDHFAKAALARVPTSPAMQRSIGWEALSHVGESKDNVDFQLFWDTVVGTTATDATPQDTEGLSEAMHDVADMASASYQALQEQTLPAQPTPALINFISLAQQGKTKLTLQQLQEELGLVYPPTMLHKQYEHAMKIYGQGKILSAEEFFRAQLDYKSGAPAGLTDAELDVEAQKVARRITDIINEESAAAEAHIYMVDMLPLAEIKLHEERVADWESTAPEDEKQHFEDISAGAKRGDLTTEVKKMYGAMFEKRRDEKYETDVALHANPESDPLYRQYVLYVSEYKRFLGDDKAKAEGKAQYDAALAAAKNVAETPFPAGPAVYSPFETNPYLVHYSLNTGSYPILGKLSSAQRDQLGRTSVDASNNSSVDAKALGQVYTTATSFLEKNLGACGPVAKLRADRKHSAVSAADFGVKFAAKKSEELEKLIAGAVDKADAFNSWRHRRLANEERIRELATSIGVEPVYGGLDFLIKHAFRFQPQVTKSSQQGEGEEISQDMLGVVSDELAHATDVAHKVRGLAWKNTYYKVRGALAMEFSADEPTTVGEAKAAFDSAVNPLADNGVDREVLFVSDALGMSYNQVYAAKKKAGEKSSGTPTFTPPEEQPSGAACLVGKMQGAVSSVQSIANKQ